MPTFVGQRSSQRPLSLPSRKDVRHSAMGQDVPGRARTQTHAPSKLDRPPARSQTFGKFISLKEYQDGFADRRRWTALWPHIHKPVPLQRKPHAPRPAAADSASHPPAQAPAPLARPAQRVHSASVSPSQAVPGPRKSAPPNDLAPDAPLASDVPQALQPLSAAPVTMSEVGSPSITEEISSPVRDASDEDLLTPLRFHSGPKPPQPDVHAGATIASAPSNETLPQAKSWWRVSLNRGVQRAMAIGKLAADGLDLMGAAMVSCITGSAVIHAVMKNFKADWHQLVRGERAPPGQAPDHAGTHAADLELIAGLTEARAKMKNMEGLQARKLKSLKRAVWCRGLTLAACLFGLGMSGATVAANPVLGGVMLGLSVYAARQAYANWRLARSNLHEFRHGGTPSPMGSNALGHVLLAQYVQDDKLKLTPSERQLRAVTRSMAVSGITLAASVTTGGLSAAASAAGAAAPNALAVTRYVMRTLGFCMAPIGELVDGLMSERAAANLAKQQAIDQSCFQMWQAYLLKNTSLCEDYERALTADRIERKVLPKGPKPFRGEVSKGKRLDLEPLVRWTRVTGRFADLQAWMAIDRAMTDSPRWADRLLADLRAIDQARNRPRWFAVVNAGTQAALSAAALAV